MNTNLNLVGRLAAELGMPTQFVAFVVNLCPANTNIDTLKQYITFTNDVLVTDDRTLTDEMEFHAQSLKHSTGLPLQLARATIKAEFITPLGDNAVAVRLDRIRFLQKVFRFRF